MPLVVVHPNDTELRETVQYIADNFGEKRQITPKLIDDICEAIERGADYHIAALACGIHWRTLNEWLESGRKLLTAHSTNLAAVLARKIDEVTARRELRSIIRLDSAGDGGALLSEYTVTKPDGSVVTERKYSAPDPKVDMWFLERKYPHKWGKITTVTGSIDHTVKTLTDVEIDNKITEILTGIVGAPVQKLLEDGQHSEVDTQYSEAEMQYTDAEIVSDSEEDA